MIVLDTNVLSEIMKSAPNQAVSDWLAKQTLVTLYLPSIVAAELLYGVAALPDGNRKQTLSNQLDILLSKFTDRTLSFDKSAAKAYAQILADAKRQGLAIHRADGYIASIAKANNMMVATRDIGPYKAAGIKVINPWED